jgi:hypothetical protein
MRFTHVCIGVTGPDGLGCMDELTTQRAYVPILVSVV